MENENPKYSFDTSAFIDSWKRYYPIDLFPSVWKFIAEKIKDNSIKSTILVKKELERQKDNLWEYIT